MQTQLPISYKSSLRSFTEVLKSWSLRNREVSSANSLHSLLRPSDNLSIYIKNNKGPKVHPWGTPALPSTQDEDWLFKTTLCFLLWRKSHKMLMISLLISFWLSLKIRLSCHTVPNAFEISENIPQNLSFQQLNVQFNLQRNVLFSCHSPGNLKFLFSEMICNLLHIKWESWKLCF